MSLSIWPLPLATCGTLGYNFASLCLIVFPFFLILFFFFCFIFREVLCSQKNGEGTGISHLAPPPPQAQFNSVQSLSRVRLFVTP